MLSVTGGNLIEENEFIQEDLFASLDDNKEKFDEFMSIISELTDDFSLDGIITEVVDILLVALLIIIVMRFFKLKFKDKKFIYIFLFLFFGFVE